MSSSKPKALSPSESLALVEENNETVKDTKYQRGRSQRKDTRPSQKGAKVCNHVTGQFYDRLFKSKKFHPKLEPNAIPLQSFTTPQNENESLLSERLGLLGYQFNYPRRAIGDIKVQKILNLSTNMIETEEKLIKGYKHKNQIYPGDTKQQRELGVRWSEYQAMINLPLDFRKKYPYIYNVLRDQFITKIVMYRNMKKMYQMQQIMNMGMVVLGQALVKTYNILAKQPNITQTLRSDPDTVKDLKEIEETIEVLVLNPEDPQTLIKFKSLLNLDEYTKQNGIHGRLEKARYIQACKKKYANRCLIIPEESNSK